MISILRTCTVAKWRSLFDVASSVVLMTMAERQSGGGCTASSRGGCVGLISSYHHDEHDHCSYLGVNLVNHDVCSSFDRHQVSYMGASHIAAWIHMSSCSLELDVVLDKNQDLQLHGHLLHCADVHHHFAANSVIAVDNTRFAATIVHLLGWS